MTDTLTRAEKATLHDFADSAPVVPAHVTNEMQSLEDRGLLARVWRGARARDGWRTTPAGIEALSATAPAAQGEME